MKKDAIPIAHLTIMILEMIASSAIIHAANVLGLLRKTATAAPLHLKKFDFFIDNIGHQACCGCGRCIDVCPGKIDIRYILRKLYDEKYIPAN